MAVQRATGGYRVPFRPTSGPKQKTSRPLNRSARLAQEFVNSGISPGTATTIVEQVPNEAEPFVQGIVESTENKYDSLLTGINEGIGRLENVLTPLLNYQPPNIDLSGLKTNVEDLSSTLEVDPFSDEAVNRIIEGTRDYNARLAQDAVKSLEANAGGRVGTNLIDAESDIRQAQIGSNTDALTNLLAEQEKANAQSNLQRAAILGPLGVDVGKLDVSSALGTGELDLSSLFGSGNVARGISGLEVAKGESYPDYVPLFEDLYNITSDYNNAEEIGKVSDELMTALEGSNEQELDDVIASILSIAGLGTGNIALGAVGALLPDIGDLIYGQ